MRSVPAQEQLGQTLVEIGLITEAQRAEAAAACRASKRRLIEEIVASNVATEDRIVTELSKHVQMDVVDPVRTPIHPQVLGIIDPEIAYDYRMIPLARRRDGDEEVLFVVVADPFDGRPLDAIRPLVAEDVDIRFVLAGDSEILAALDQNYGPNPRPDTVSAPPPPLANMDTSVRFGGSAAEPLSASILPGDLMGAEATELAEPRAPRAPTPASTPPPLQAVAVVGNGATNDPGESGDTAASSLPPLIAEHRIATESVRARSHSSTDGAGRPPPRRDAAVRPAREDGSREGGSVRPRRQDPAAGRKDATPPSRGPTEAIRPLRASADPSLDATLPPAPDAATDSVPPEPVPRRRPASPTEPVRGVRNAQVESIGDFALEERIGVQGVAETWRARRSSGPSAGAVVHVRRMLPSLSKNERSRQRFFGAAQSLVDVDDTHVVRVITAESEAGEDFVVTEAVDGTDLERLLRAAADKKLEVPIPIALKIAQGIARGLKAAHEQGIWHLELTPRTVIVTRDGTVKVTDFRVAAGLIDDRGRYVAPEQVTADAGDARTDVYRLGLILYELLAGVPLVASDVKDPARAQEAVRQFRTTLAEARYDVSPSQEKLIAGALRPDPEKRHETITAFLAAIDEELARSRTAASAASIMRFVDRVENTPGPEPARLQDNAAEVLSSAAAAMKRVEERARPALLRAGDVAVDAFDTFMSAPTPIKVAVAGGAFLTLVIASAIVAVTMSSRDAEDTAPITLVDEAPKPPPKRTATRDVASKATAGAAIELMPDVVDEPAPDGFAYAKTHGLELRATASDDGEVLFWLEVGQLVREMGEVEGKRLVLIPPRGPAGFVDAEALTGTLPLEALARQVAFDDCSVSRRRTLDDCLYDAKQSETACTDRCLDRSAGRCVPMCQLAFDRCIASCRSSDAAEPPPPRRRRRRR